MDLTHFTQARKPRHRTFNPDFEIRFLDEPEEEVGIDLVSDIRLTPTIIDPELHYYDSRILSDMEKEVEKATPGFETHKRVLPERLVEDIYQVFNLPAHKMNFAKQTEQTDWRLKLIQGISHYYMRTLTERNALSSYIVAEEITKALLAYLNPKEPDPPGTTPQSSDDMLKDLLDNMKALARNRDSAFKKAEDRISKQEEQSQLGLQAGDGYVDDLQNAQKILDFGKQLGRVKIPVSTLQKFIKQTLKFSNSYFSDKFKEYEEDIFDSDQIEDIFEIEGLLPQLLPAYLDSITTTFRKYFFSYDIYIDRSGSMGARVMDNGKMTSMTCLELCKLCAIYMMNKGIVRNVHFFDGMVSVPTQDVQKVLRTSAGGGTITENVIKQAVREKTPSLILTDMCDNITTYTPYAYFIGVNNAQLYSGEIGDKYLARGQFARYEDGKLELVKPN